MSYTELEWIRNNVAAMYINTGYKPNQDTRIHMKISNPGQNAYFFNAWSDNWNKNNYSCINDYAYSGGNIFSAYGDQTGSNISVLVGENEIDYNKNILTINGNIIESFEYTVFQSLYDMYLFAQNRKGTVNYHTNHFAFNLHWCKIYENDILIYDFIPVLDENKVACLYDKISETYFYNQGTGAFTYAKKATYLYYIESDGTQYINLNYTHTSKTKIELECQVFKNSNSSTTWEALFGSRYKSYINNAYIFFSRTAGADVPRYNRSGYETEGENFIYDEKITLICYQKTATWTTNDGTSYSITTKGASDGGVAPMFLFDLNNAQKAGGINPDNSKTVMRVYSLKIYEGETLVRNYQPVIDSDEIACLLDTVEKYMYYPTTGNNLKYRKNGTFFLVRSNNIYYTISNNILSSLEATEISAELFKTYGIKDIPNESLLLTLENPEVLYWQESEEDILPTLTASMTATPFSQTIISNKIDLTDESILGIENIAVDCEGELLMAVSFDEKQTWKVYSESGWATALNDFTGMSKETVEAITYEQWNELYAEATDFYIRIALTDSNQSVKQITVNFLKE